MFWQPLGTCHVRAGIQTATLSVTIIRLHTTKTKVQSKQPMPPPAYIHRDMHHSKQELSTISNGKRYLHMPCQRLGMSHKWTGTQSISLTIINVSLHTTVANVQSQPPVLPQGYIEVMHESKQESSINIEDNSIRTCPDHHFM